MKVLSLFDGISSGRLALERAGIPVEKYYASEIDKYAIQVAQKNYPDTIQVGDVTKLNYLELLDIDMVIGGSPCFQADTMVFTDKGYIPIQDIQIGDMVLTHNGRYKPVLAVGKRWANNCRKLKAETMLPILTTGNHPFLTDKDFVECDNLNKGDIVIAAKTDFSGEDMSLVDAYLLGRYVADGYIIDSLRTGRKNSYNHKVVFCVGKGKNEQFEFFTFAKHFIKSKDKNVTKYTIIDKNFMELCKKCGKGALNKQIPQIIFSCPTEIKKMFLQGYMDGDGNKYKDGYTATTVSKKLALGLQLLLSSLGCKNHIYFNKRPKKYIIQGRIVNQHDTYQVRFYPNAKEWVKEKKIQSKLQIEDNYVYNIEVADDHTYIADNYIVHNCQDLSIAKQNREGLRGARSGLFWKYVEALEVIRPKWFLLENVASMRNEDRDAITATLKKIYPETECIMINSALVSAQQRKRYYWTNWHVEQPQDKGILLKDILESGVIDKEKSTCLTANIWKGNGANPLEYIQKHQAKPFCYEPIPCAMRTREDELGKFKRVETKDDGKANSLTSVQTDSMVCMPVPEATKKGYTEIEKGNCVDLTQMSSKTRRGRSMKYKSNCLTAGECQFYQYVEPVRIGELDGLGKGQANRIYSVRGKSVCLNANGGGGGAKTGLYKVDLPDGDYIIRKLTPVECARLQTMPDHWCELGLSLRFQNTYDIIKSTIKGHSRCKNVELKTAQIQYPTSLLDYATSIICDLSDMEQQSLQETQLTKQNTVLLRDVIKNNKQDADIVLNTIKDLKEQEALNYQKENQRNVSIAIEWQLQEKCVIGTIKIGNATMMHNLQIRLEKEQINTDIKRLKEIIESNIEKSFQSCSEENYMHKKWYTILTWINLIIMKKIYTSVIIPNTQVFINSLIKLRENLLDLELSNLKTESITSISPTQQYKAIGNGWTVDVISHILKQIPNN